MSSESPATPDLDQPVPGGFPSASPRSLSVPKTLWQAIHERRGEYVRPRQVRLKVGTWNVAAFKGTEKDLGGWFVAGKGIEEALTGLGVSNPHDPQTSSPLAPLPKADLDSLPDDDKIGLYVLGLQEAVDIASPAEALRPYTDPTAAAKFKAAVQSDLPHGYRLVAEQQLIGLLLLVYVSPELAPELRSVSTTSVGTGLMGYVGNKGAVAARIGLGETTRLLFINSHLAAGVDKTSCDRRNWDTAQIVSRTKVEAIVDPLDTAPPSCEGVGDEDFAFWFGDLNYRLSGMPAEDVRRLLMLHTRNEYDLSQRHAETIENDIAMSARSSFEVVDGSVDESTTSPMSDETPKLDPTSLQATIDSLLPHDELRQQQRLGKAFHDGWREGDICFLPTYKYDVGTVGIFDSSDKRRCPSWCDRILYRTRRDRLAYHDRVTEEHETRKKDAEMKNQGLDGDHDDQILFEYDPETDGDFDYDEATDAREDDASAAAERSSDDDIILEYYTAHQRVLSSDHKPLDAVFRLRYDSVVPELKAKIYSEVARELDRAENEGRPDVTLIVESDQRRKKTKNCDKSNSEGVDFGQVRYLGARQMNVTVANTGQVAATISLLGSPGGESSGDHSIQTPSPPLPPTWLSLRFDRDPDRPAEGATAPVYTLEPGDACNIDLILRVDDLGLVRSLNRGTTQLEGILVLRVRHGRDQFLPVRAAWLQTSLARSINELIRVPEGGFRRLQRDNSSINNNSNSPAGVKWSAPRELFRLTEVLEDLVERTLAEWDMTEHGQGEKAPWSSSQPGSGSSGWPFAPESWTCRDTAEREGIQCAIIDALDSDSPIERAFAPDTSSLLRVECLAETMVAFLRSLDDGIVTPELWQTIEAGYNKTTTMHARGRDDERAWILDIMSCSPNHSVCFVLLTSMLARIAAEIRTAAAGVVQPAPRTQTSPLRRTLSGVAGRAKSLSEAQRAQAVSVERGLSSALSDVMVRLPPRPAMKDKDRQAQRQRICRLVELFVLPDGKA